MFPRSIGWLGPLALTCASLLLSFCVLEVAVRAFHPAPILWTYPQEFYDFDAEIAHTLRPLQQAFTHDKPVSINSMGLRDREFPASPPPGVTRVMAMGDSQTFGNGLSAADTWPKQLERALSATEAPGTKRWEVLNAGIPGTDTWQHERWLGRLMDRYHPQIVVLAFYVNDVTPPYVPTHRKSAGKSNTASSRVAYLLKRSALVSLVLQRLAALEHAEQSEKGRAFGDYIVTGEFNERVERGWTQVGKSLEAMKTLAESRGAQFVLAVLPRRDQVSGALESEVYNRRIAGIAASRRIPNIDLLSELKRAFEVEGEALFIPWDGHNSARANKFVADRLSEILASGSGSTAPGLRHHHGFADPESKPVPAMTERVLEATHSQRQEPCAALLAMCRDSRA